MSKSLEIVNKKINYCEKQEVPFISIRLVSLQQIKQDLEVLEILRKHLFIEKYEISWFDIDLDEKEHKEHFNKVKQWLEG